MGWVLLIFGTLAADSFAQRTIVSTVPLTVNCLYLTILIKNYAVALDTEFMDYQRTTFPSVLCTSRQLSTEKVGSTQLHPH